MASFSGRLSRLASVCSGSVCLRAPCPHPAHAISDRFYRRLPKTVTGLRQWEEARAKTSEEIDLGSLCGSLLQRVDTDRYIKCSQVNKVFDRCMSKDDLNRAEKVLERFRRSLSKCRPSLPMVVVRACLRIGQPRRALHYARDKVNFGIFPTRRVYKVIIEALLLEGNAQGAVAAYKLLLADEIEPDGMIYYLAAMAHARLGTPEGGEVALEMCERCQALETKLGTKSYRRVVERLLKEEETVGEGKELLEKLQQRGVFPKQTLFNLQVDCLVAQGDYTGAVRLLEEMCGLDNKDLIGLGAPKLGLPRLKVAVKKSDDETLKRSLEVLVKEKLPSYYRKLPSISSSDS